MPDITKVLGHTKIDVLKMDIENGEFVAIPQIFNSSSRSVETCQLLVEVHPTGSSQWISLLKTIARAGFLMFSREANTYCSGVCFEYAFVHEQCLVEYGIETELIHRNFYI